MKRHFFVLVAVFIATTSIISLVPGGVARAYSSPGTPSGFVNDFAHVLDATAKQNLEAKLLALQRETGFELAVVTVSSLGGDTVENYAEKLFQEWGIGDKKIDNGLLLVVSMEDRKIRIETGYGTEAVVTDLQAGNIIRNVITPAFKEGRYSEGISTAADALISVITHSPDSSVYSRPQSSTSGFSDETAGLIIFIFVIIANGLARILGKTSSWWLGGVIGAIAGVIIGLIWGFIYVGVISLVILTLLGLLFDFVVSKSGIHGGHGGFWFGSSGSSGGSFGGFGGGGSGGGGSSGSW